MYTFTMVGCTLFKLCYCKCAKAYLLEILGMSRLWHDLLAHGLIRTFTLSFYIYIALFQVCNDLYTKREALIFHAKLTVTFPNVDIVIQVHLV